MNPWFWRLGAGALVALMMALWGPPKWVGPSRLWMTMAVVMTVLMLWTSG